MTSQTTQINLFDAICGKSLLLKKLNKDNLLSSNGGKWHNILILNF